MVIGSFGNIIFKVSKKKSLFLTKISDDASAEYNTHDTIGCKAKKEFSKAGLRNTTIDIYVSANYGYTPRKVRNSLINKCENGEAEYLIIGGKPLSMNKYVINSVSNEWGTIYKNGKLASMNITLSLSEYV